MVSFADPRDAVRRPLACVPGLWWRAGTWDRACSVREQWRPHAKRQFEQRSSLATDYSSENQWFESCSPEAQRLTGPENIRLERTRMRLPGRGPVNSPSRITLEYNGKIRPQPDRENAFAKASGGGEGTAGDPSLGARPLPAGWSGATRKAPRSSARRPFCLAPKLAREARVERRSGGSQH